MRYLSVLISLTLYVVLSGAAYACSCAYGGYWVSDFVKDKTVFEGRPKMTQWLGERQPGNYRLYNSKTSFLIANPVWNISEAEVSLAHSSEDAASCGINFSMGVEILVVAYLYENELLRTSSCTANAVDEITLINYFEKDIDLYIPSLKECSEEQIKDPKDPKNCFYLSMQAEQERSIEASKRRRAKWKEKYEAKKALTLSNETP
jgi:hypothetical protein